MRDLARYFLALMVMGTGFYAAQQHRRPERLPANDEVAAREDTTDFLPRDVRGSRKPVSGGTLPVAALADVDRAPLFDPDRPTARHKSGETVGKAVVKQPTLRADKLVQNASAEKPTAPQHAKKPDARSGERAERDTKEPASPKPAAKKPDKKKPAASKPAAEQGLDTAEPNEAAVPPDFARQYRPFFQIAEDSPYQPGDKSADAKPQKDTRSAPAQAEQRATKAAADARPQKDTRSAQANSQPTKPRSPTAAAPRRHRIAEGDTLPRLAEKYLGSRDRYLELLQLNSEVLFDARLIPIGVEIVIPDRSTVVAKAVGGPVKAAGKDDASRDDDLWDASVPLPAMVEN